MKLKISEEDKDALIGFALATITFIGIIALAVGEEKAAAFWKSIGW